MRLRHLAAATLVLASCHCAQPDDQLRYRCGPAGECEPGRTCDGAWCVPAASGGGSAAGGRAGGATAGGVTAGGGGSGGGNAAGGTAGGACIPTKSCDADSCGSLGDDGCGATVECGICQGRLRCGVLQPNKCECIKADAGSLVCTPPDAGEVACGTKTIDNCGANETFTCGGACQAGQLCFDNLCCTPPTQAELCSSSTFLECGRGEVIDRCGQRRIITCPGCPAGEMCIPIESGTACVPAAACVGETAPEFCDLRGANCGTLSGLDRCGVMRTNVVCGGPCDAGECTSTMPNQCTCQALLSGCTQPAQCCSGLECGTAGLCCVGNQQACNDDSDCCGGATYCQQGRCCDGPGVACTSGSECCSGLCLADGGCDVVDGGNTWDGGEL